MRKILAWVLVWLALTAPAMAQSLGVAASFLQTGQAFLTATTTTGRVALGSAASVAWVCNFGSVTTYVSIGNLNITTSLTTGLPVQAGQCASLTATGQGYIAGITASSTASLSISTGTGWPSTSSSAIISGPVNWSPTTSAMVTTAATVNATSAQALASGSRVYLKIANASATATIACAFGATAAINTAGSLTLLPYAATTFEQSYVPNDAVNCIASQASTPVTILSK